MKITPLGDRVLCKLVELGDKFGSIVIPEKYQQRYGLTVTGAPHALCQVLAMGPDVSKELCTGEYVLVEGMNVEWVSPVSVQGEKDVCLPRDKAILVRFLSPPVA